MSISQKSEGRLKERSGPNQLTSETDTIQIKHKNTADTYETSGLPLNTHKETFNSYNHHSKKTFKMAGDRSAHTPSEPNSRNNTISFHNNSFFSLGPGSNKKESTSPNELSKNQISAQILNKIKTPLKQSFEKGKMLLEKEFTFQKQKNLSSETKEEVFGDLSGLYLDSGRKDPLARNKNIIPPICQNKTVLKDIIKPEEPFKKQISKTCKGGCNNKKCSQKNQNLIINQSISDLNQIPIKKKNSIFDLLNCTKKENLCVNKKRKKSIALMKEKPKLVHNFPDPRQKDKKIGKLFYTSFDEVPTFGRKSKNKPNQNSEPNFPFPVNSSLIRVKKSPYEKRNLFGNSIFPGKGLKLMF